jgi:hypothetical protein
MLYKPQNGNSDLKSGSERPGPATTRTGSNPGMATLRLSEGVVAWLDAIRTVTILHTRELVALYRRVDKRVPRAGKEIARATAAIFTLEVKEYGLMRFLYRAFWALRSETIWAGVVLADKLLNGPSSD